MFQVVLQPDDATKALLNRALQLIVQVDVRTKQMATAFEIMKEEMAQSRTAIDLLAAALQSVRAQLEANAANGLSPEQTAELKQEADDAQAAAAAALAGPAPAPEEPPEAT